MRPWGTRVLLETPSHKIMFASSELTALITLWPLLAAMVSRGM
jgi:hypothetical protein